MKKVNRSIMYAGNFEVSPMYISELAHMLNEEEPWNKMMPGDICSYLGESIFAKDAAKKKNEMIKNATPQQLETDEKLLTKLKYYENRIYIASLLRRVSKERYGNDFDSKNK